MNNHEYVLKIVSIFLIIILLISTSVVVIAEKEITNKKIDKNLDQLLLKHIKILRGWATGYAISGKTIGFRGTIAKINFEYLKMEWYQIIPPRWQMTSFYNVTAVFFNVNQTIPQGPFEYGSDWVLAIIFQ